jgi:hypothetical protein
MRRGWALVFLIVSLHFIGCANLQTISRLTTLPKEKPGPHDYGVAIHLDAVQRLVLVKAIGDYCAEPSPDALAAYASALGLGISIPGKGGGSLAEALSSSAGSIGLRTQSITLMRDQLYRMCEAYSNGAIGPVQVATLLRRSQDLTAVILAVEQLTGAVAANQVILTSTAGAGASAALMSNQQLLDAARKDEEQKAKALDEAKKQRDALKKATDDKRIEWKGVDDSAKTAEQNKAANAGELRTAADNKKGDLTKLEADLAQAENQVKTREALLAEAKKTRETIESLKDSALTNAVANTSGAGQFSAPILQRQELSKEATQAIASTVQFMVQTVIAKEYTHDSCMDMLTFVPKNYKDWDEGQKKGNEKVRELCIQLLSQVISEMITKTQTSFAPDATTTLIKTAIDKDPALRAKLKDWMARKGFGNNEFLFLNTAEFAPARELALKDPDLKIP